ncbi:MAG: rnhB, partial [Acidimicrobiaceae bacterium]|nr:rnhB [Acidimicrobiaceae bacterium]
PARPAPRRPSPRPTWRAVEALFAEGFALVAAVDEVGRGAWAGPVAVGVVLVRPGRRRGAPAGVRDSKLLAEPVRERLFAPLAAWCGSYAVGEASPEECDELGMTLAQRVACHRALEHLGEEPDALILDGKWDYTGHRAARPIIDADATCYPVAAASVLAKVTRDRAMIAHASRFPAYGFERNKGYISPEHRRAVARFGMTELHRRRWSVAPDDSAGDEKYIDEEPPS